MTENSNNLIEASNDKQINEKISDKGKNYGDTDRQRLKKRLAN